jgi:hypothetical protein
MHSTRIPLHAGKAGSLAEPRQFNLDHAIFSGGCCHWLGVVFGERGPAGAGHVVIRNGILNTAAVSRLS